MRRLSVLTLSVVLWVSLAGCGDVAKPSMAPTPTTMPSGSPLATGTPSPSVQPGNSPQATTTQLPSVRPDDIAYVRSNHIWRVHSNGSKPVQLTIGPGSDSAPAWSLDRTHIAYVHRADPDSMTASALCVVAAAGGNVSNWEFDTLVLDLCYSPDGSHIAFVDLQMPDPEADDQSPVEHVSILDIAGGQTTPVRTLHDRFTTGMAVSWSPDGTRLLLGLSRQDAEGQRTGILTLDSGKLVWLKTPDACEAHWSPDGRSIVVNQATQSYTAVSIADTQGNIRQVLVRGGGLGSGEQLVLGGVFSPDGARVAYNDYKSTWTIEVEGKDKRRLAAHAWDPAWSAW